MANLSKASSIVQEKYVLYDVTSFTQKWHSIPVATNCNKASGKGRIPTGISPLTGYRGELQDPLSTTSGNAECCGVSDLIH